MNLLHLLNAGHQLSADLAVQVRQVAQAALERQAAPLDLDGVDVVVYSSPWTIPETGPVGHAPDGYSIHIAITPASPAFQAAWATELPATLAHELHHAKRWRSARLDSLLHALVFEGLALHFEAGERGELPLYARPARPLETLWKKAEPHLAGPYDHAAWFFGSEAAGLPRWGGYALGYELVRRFLKAQGGDAVSHVGTPAEAFGDAWRYPEPHDPRPNPH